MFHLSNAAQKSGLFTKKPLLASTIDITVLYLTSFRRDCFCKWFRYHVCYESNWDFMCRARLEGPIGIPWLKNSELFTHHSTDYIQHVLLI